MGLNLWSLSVLWWPSWHSKPLSTIQHRASDVCAATLCWTTSTLGHGRKEKMTRTSTKIRRLLWLTLVRAIATLTADSVDGATTKKTTLIGLWWLGHLTPLVAPLYNFVWHCYRAEEVWAELRGQLEITATLQRVRRHEGTPTSIRVILDDLATELDCYRRSWTRQVPYIIRPISQAQSVLLCEHEIPFCRSRSAALFSLLDAHVRQWNRNVESNPTDGTTWFGCYSPWTLVADWRSRQHLASRPT